MGKPKFFDFYRMAIILGVGLTVENVKDNTYLIKAQSWRERLTAYYELDENGVRYVGDKATF